MKTLVAFYSLFGHTRAVGNEIAKLLKADVEEIIDMEDPAGFSESRVGKILKKAFEKPPKQGEMPFTTSEFFTLAPYFLKMMKSGFFGSRIAKPSHDPAGYDLVIIGTPIWAESLTPQVKAYVKNNKSKFKRVAFYCSMGGSGGGKAFAEMKTTLGKDPVATLEIDDDSLYQKKHGPRIRAFVKKLGP